MYPARTEGEGITQGHEQGKAGTAGGPLKGCERRLQSNMVSNAMGL